MSVTSTEALRATFGVVFALVIAELNIDDTLAAGESRPTIEAATDIGSIVADVSQIFSLSNTVASSLDLYFEGSSGIEFSAYAYSIEGISASRIDQLTFNTSHEDPRQYIAETHRVCSVSQGFQVYVV